MPEIIEMPVVNGTGPFEMYNPEVHTLSQLVEAIIKPNSGINLVADSIVLKYGAFSDWGGDEGTSLSFFDGSLAELGIGAGLLLTSGDGAPPLENTSGSYGKAFSETFGYTGTGDSADPDLNAVAQAAFAGAGSITDTTLLEFTINVTDPSVQSIQFSLVFGSDEYPEFSDTSFVDVAAVFVNGVNHALFNGQPDQPLSVISKNLEVGNFINNSPDGVILPIEYDGLSSLLNVTAAVQPGLNTIKIGVADTGDTAYDSGLFVANLQGVGYQVGPGQGIIVDDDIIDINDPLIDFTNPFAKDLYNLPFELENGAFVFGTDNMTGQLIKGSLDNLVTAKFDFSLAEIDLEKSNWNIDPEAKYNYIEIHATFGGSQKFIWADKMIFDDFAAAMDTWVGSDTWNTFSLLKVAFGSDPTPTMLTEWLLKGEEASNINELAGLMIDEYAPVGFTPGDLVSYLYQTITGTPLDDPSGMLSFLAGFGKTTSDEILGFAAENYADMSPIQGLFVPLDVALL